MRQFQGQPSLADSTSAGERQDSRAGNQLGDLGKLTLSSDKCRWLDLERVALGRPRRPWPAGGHERRPLGRAQLKCRCQTRGCVRIWKAPGAAFQIGDAAAANASALSERFLREPRHRSTTA